jgi:hypothetical protein
MLSCFWRSSSKEIPHRQEYRTEHPLRETYSLAFKIQSPQLVRIVGEERTIKRSMLVQHMMYNDDETDKEALNLQARPHGSVSANAATTRVSIVGMTVNTVEVAKIVVMIEGVTVVGTGTGENVEMVEAETETVPVAPAGQDVSVSKMVMFRVAWSSSLEDAVDVNVEIVDADADADTCVCV